MTLNKKDKIYKQLTEKIYNRCQQIQTENARSVLRLNGIKKLLRRRSYDVALLKKKLDKHGDNWRSIPMVVPQPKPEQKRRGPKPKDKQIPTNTHTVEALDTVPSKPRRQRVKKQTDALAHHATVPQNS